ncbi:MAG: hypothetical protein ACYCOU_07410 [Sulfobacillus sp.]
MGSKLDAQAVALLRRLKSKRDCGWPIQEVDADTIWVQVGNVLAQIDSREKVRRARRKRSACKQVVHSAGKR